MATTQAMRDRVHALELEVMKLRREKQLAETTNRSSRKRHRAKEKTFANPTQSYMELHRVPVHSDKLYEQLIHQTIHNTSRAPQVKRRHKRKSRNTLVKGAEQDDSDIDADTRQLIPSDLRTKMSQNFPRDSSRPSQQQQQNTEVSDDILDYDRETDERFEDFMKKLGRMAKIKRQKEKKVNTYRSMPRRVPPLKSEPSHFSGDFRKLTLSEHGMTLHQSSPDRSNRGGVSPTQRAGDVDNSSIQHSDGLNSVQTISVHQTAMNVEHDQLNKAKASEAKLRKKVSDTLTTVAIKVVPLDYVLQKTVARWRYDRLQHGLTTWKAIHNATKAYEQEISTAVRIIQRTGRTYLQALNAKRLEMAKKILAVTALQRIVRGRLARRAYRDMKILSRVDKLQAYARRYLARRRVKRLLRLRLVELLKVLAPLGRLSRLHAAIKSMGKRQNQVRSALQMIGKAQRYRVRQLCRACIHMRAVPAERKVAMSKQKMKRHQQRAARQDAEAKQLEEADKYRRKVYEKRERQRLLAEQRLAAQREIDANKAQAKRLRASENHRKQVAEQRLAQLLEARKRRSKSAQYQTVFKDLVHLGDATEKLTVHVHVKRSKLTGEAQITVSDPEQKTCAVSLTVSLPEEVSGEYRTAIIQLMRKLLSPL